MKKFLAVLLAVLTILSCACAIPVAAEDEEEVKIDWKFDLNAMQTPHDTMGNSDIQIEAKENNTIVEINGEKCLSIKNVLSEGKNSRYIIHDVNDLLVKPKTFYVDYDIYFESFPTGTREGLTPDEYPMSFFTWVINSKKEKVNYDRGIRIDSKGRLYYTRDTSHVINAKLELKTWYNVRFAISPASGNFEVYIDNKPVCSRKYPGLGSIDGSYLRFFDTGLDYHAYLKNVKVLSNSDFLGTNRENTADYIGYQVSKVQNDKFSVRFLADLKDKDANYTGYQILNLAIMNDGQKIETCNEYMSAEIYDSILADGRSVSASELEAEQLTLCTVSELDVNARSSIIAVRPFIVKNGHRQYGEAKLLYFKGEIKDGYPVLEREISEATEGLTAIDDSFLRNKSGNFGKNDILEIKNNGSIENANNRRIIVKFEIEDYMVDTILAMDTVNFQMFLKSTRTNYFNDDEKDNGGVAANVYAIDNDWDEETATFATYTPKIGEKVGVLRMNGSGYQKLNIASYLHKQLNAGERYFSFLIENAVDDGSEGQTMFYSKEAGAAYAPMLAFDTVSFYHEINLEKKLFNYGFEPWGVAEEIVSDWFGELKEKVYAVGKPDAFELEKVDVTKPGGTHTVLTEGTLVGNPPVPKYEKQYARTIDTLISAGGYIEDESLFPVYDEYGGISNFGIKGEATGFFHVEIHGDRPYMIDPLGNPFFIVGVSSLIIGTYNQELDTLRKYGTAENFWKEITKELRSYGINTGSGDHESFSSTETPLMGFVGLSGIQDYMEHIGLVVTTGVAPEYKNNDTMNVFDPDFESFVLENNQKVLTKYADNNRIFGFTSDNEMTDSTTLLSDYLTIDPENPENAFSYAVAWSFLAEATDKLNPALEDVTPELEEEFKCLIFTKTLGAVRKAIDTYAPNHMYLGNRTDAGNKKSEGYLRAAGYNCDILSINMYDGMQPSVANMATIYRYSGKPFFVSEFYAKAEESYDMNGEKLGNHENAGWMVKTQKDRASYYENYTTLLLECKYCVGWAWFGFRDNDQSLYYPSETDHSKILRIWEKGSNLNVVSYIDSDGKVYRATGNEYRFYTGIVNDMSSIGSNKGLYTNQTEPYQELIDAYTRVSNNIIGLIRYFDEINK